MSHTDSRSGARQLAGNHAELVDLAGRIATEASACAHETERERGLPEALVERLRGAGLLNAGAPAAVGGFEAPPAVALRCAEEISRGDASVGWWVAIAITSSLLAAYLPPETAVELFGRGQIASGVWAPKGRGRPVAGGVVVSGQWAFCSGIPHADLAFLGCVIEDETVPRIVTLSKDDLNVLDTWHTLGLRGTGSHDVVADDVFVPSERVFSLFDGPVVDRPLYRFPVFGFFALAVAVPGLGNARGAIDDLVELAAGKVGLGSSRTLAERASTQAAVSQAEALLRGSRALLYEAVDAAWDEAQKEGTVSVPRRTDLRLAATQAARTSAEIVRSMYDLAGGTAIYDSSPLQKRFRDAHTATAHFQVNETSRELTGRILLGLPADTSTL